MTLLSNIIVNLSQAQLESLKSSFENTEGMINFDEAMLLYSLAKNVHDGCIIEVGSYRGRSTAFLGKGSLDGGLVPIYAVDPHKEFIGVLGGVFGPKDRTAFYRTMLETGCSEIVSLINLSSEYFASTWDKPVSLLWIDGDHSYEGVKRDFQCWSQYLTAGAFIAFDDATNPELGPRKLIDELVASKDFEEVGSVVKIVVLRRTQH